MVVKFYTFHRRKWSKRSTVVSFFANLKSLKQLNEEVAETTIKESKQTIKKKKKEKLPELTLFWTLNIRFPIHEFEITLDAMQRGTQSVSICIWCSIYDQRRYYTYNSVYRYSKVYSGWHTSPCIKNKFKTSKGSDTINLQSIEKVRHFSFTTFPGECSRIHSDNMAIWIN